jgi:hypothetical protein
MASRHPAPCIVAAFGVFLAVLHGLALADANSEFEQHREEERKSTDAMLAHLPALDERNIGGLLRIAVENKVLVLQTGLANTERDGFMRVKVADLGLAAVVRVTGAAPAATRPAATAPATTAPVTRPTTTAAATTVSETAGPALAPVIPAFFQLQFTDCRKPLQIDAVTVTLQSGTVQINVSSQFPDDRFANVCLTQRCDADAVRGARMHLTINEGGRSGAAPINLSIEAADFFTLVRQHPAVADTWLRPMFRELKQERVFAPDPLIAWQVFPELWTADPAISRKVKELLPVFEQDDFHARSQALLDLEKLGREGAAVLLRLDRAPLSAEQNARIDLALGPYPTLTEKYARQLRSEVMFLLDCLYSDDLALRRLALEKLRATLSKETIAFDVGAGPEVRAAAVEVLRKQLVRGAKH